MNIYDLEQEYQKLRWEFDCWNTGSRPIEDLQEYNDKRWDLSSMAAELKRRYRNGEDLDY